MQSSKQSLRMPAIALSGSPTAAANTPQVRFRAARPMPTKQRSGRDRGAVPRSGQGPAGECRTLVRRRRDRPRNARADAVTLSSNKCMQGVPDLGWAVSARAGSRWPTRSASAAWARSTRRTPRRRWQRPQKRCARWAWPASAGRPRQERSPARSFGSAHSFKHLHLRPTKTASCEVDRSFDSLKPRRKGSPWSVGRCQYLPMASSPCGACRP